MRGLGGHDGSGTLARDVSVEVWWLGVAKVGTVREETKYKRSKELWR